MSQKCTLSTGAVAPVSLPYGAHTRWETRQTVRTGTVADIKIYPEGARASAGALATVHVRCGREHQAEALAQLIAAAPELLAELRVAHQVIRHARIAMNTSQRIEWSRLNAAAGMDGESVMCDIERAELLARLKGGAV